MRSQLGLLVAVSQGLQYPRLLLLHHLLQQRAHDGRRLNELTGHCTETTMVETLRGMTMMPRAVRGCTGPRASAVSVAPTGCCHPESA